MTLASDQPMIVVVETGVFLPYFFAAALISSSSFPGLSGEAKRLTICIFVERADALQRIDQRRFIQPMRAQQDRAIVAGAAQRLNQSDILTRAGMCDDNGRLHRHHALRDRAELRHGRRKQDRSGLHAAGRSCAFGELACGNAAGRLDAVADHHAFAVHAFWRPACRKSRLRPQIRGRRSRRMAAASAAALP